MHALRLTTLAAAAALTAGAASADFTVNILHFNDLHGRFEPISKYDGSCSAEDDAEGKCFGGVARMKTFIDGRRAELGDATLLVSAGDMFQGTLYYTTYKGDATAEFMTAIGLDATAVGNHEFDDGPEVLARFINNVEFPVIAGNVDASAEPALSGLIDRYAIVEIGGEKIGLIGAVTTDTPEIASPGPNVKFIDEVEHFNEVVAELEAMGVNKIIALTHVGHNRDMEIAAQAAGVDAIIGGHSNTYLSSSDPKRDGPYPTWITNEATGALVPVMQAYAYSKYVGQVAITFDDAGAVIDAQGDTHLITPDIAKDPGVEARIAALAAPIEALKNKVIGALAAPIDGDRKSCRARECEMGVLVAEAMLDRVKGQGVSIAIQNGGGIRASIDGGEVTMGEVLTVLPFQNTLATFWLKGADMVAALENGVSQVEDGGGRFPQVAGMRFAWNPAAAPGSRVTAVEVKTGDGWAPLDPEAEYGVVTNNYVRGGGDGYKTFAAKARDAYDYGPGLEQVVADYIAAHSPYQPVLRGAIVEGEGF